MKYYLMSMLMLLMSGCGLLSNTTIDPAPQQVALQQENSYQLYYDIGGNDGIERITDAFIKQIARDPDILPYFAKSSVSHFKQGFISHLCATVKGPCEYSGDSMIDIHTGMNINEKDFNRTVELLIAAMEDADVSYRDQNRILKALAPLRVEIIHH